MYLLIEFSDMNRCHLNFTRYTSGKTGCGHLDQENFNDCRIFLSLSSNVLIGNDFTSKLKEKTSLKLKFCLKFEKFKMASHSKNSFFKNLRLEPNFGRKLSKFLKDTKIKF